MTVISSAEFERFFKAHYRPLCLFAIHYIGDPDDAEDIVQQTFSETWDKLQNSQHILNLKAYLYQSVRNNTLYQIEKNRKNISLSDEARDFEDLSLEEQIFNSERDARLWKAIEQLPPERRKILLLSKRDGLKYQEIADELKISVKTVENQIGKALKTLREKAIQIYHHFF
ncbi:MAG: RNA polymerase sigma-70 factor [Bacteroidales bacterium]